MTRSRKLKCGAGAGLTAAATPARTWTSKQEKDRPENPHQPAAVVVLLSPTATVRYFDGAGGVIKRGRGFYVAKISYYCNIAV